MNIIEPGVEVGYRDLLDGMWELRPMGCTKDKDSAHQCQEQQEFGTQTTGSVIERIRHL